MANDPSLALRFEVVKLLRATNALASITTDAKVFGEAPDPMPAFPFTRYGVDETTPKDDSCGHGAEVEFPIHSFSGAKFTDQVRQMNAAVANALHEAVIELDELGTVARLVWLGSTVARDLADPKAWHGTARFRATI